MPGAGDERESVGSEPPRGELREAGVHAAIVRAVEVQQRDPGCGRRLPDERRKRPVGQPGGAPCRPGPAIAASTAGSSAAAS